MPSPPALAHLAMQTCATAVALACGFLMHRDVRINVYTLEDSIDFESVLHDPCYNAWFSRHLRCFQETFLLLCSMLRVHFLAVAYKTYSFERAVASSSGGYGWTPQALGACQHTSRLRPQHSRFGKQIDLLLLRGFHVLTDSGYGIAPSVMTPYSAKGEGGTLTRRQARYNFYHSSTRMIIERVLEEQTPAASVRVIVACLVLHNIFIDFNDETEFLDGDGTSAIFVNDQAETQDRGSYKQRTKLKKEKRDDIAALFSIN
ncbi:Harbinger transposase-derived nuclease domain [Phytophthora cactorum]|nr:Harbinger transposase-derived nuclease domain [Phytophthora cactorum]